jgi:hypothetical protein
MMESLLGRCKVWVAAMGGRGSVGRRNEHVQLPNKPVLELAEDGVDLWPLCRGPHAMRLD